MEEDAEAGEPETPPQLPEPLPTLPPQQSLAAQPIAHMSPPEEVGPHEHEEVMVSKNMVVEIGGVMTCDGGKRDGGVYADGQGEIYVTETAAPAAATATWCYRP